MPTPHLTAQEKSPPCERVGAGVSICIGARGWGKDALKIISAPMTFQEICMSLDELAEKL